MPFLKRTFDQELKTVAGFDLSTSKDEAALSAADAWWDVAEHRKKERQQILPRCAFWYEKAIPILTGIPKANAEKRLQAAYQAISETSGWGTSSKFTRNGPHYRYYR